MDSSIRRNLQDLYIGNPTKQVLQFSYFPVDPRAPAVYYQVH